MKKEIAEERMQNMKNAYLKLDNVLNHLPDAIPEKMKGVLRDKILGDKQLKELMEGIDEHRPPRFFLIGRTGVGKSSLINALCGSYLAKVSDMESCTSDVDIYHCMDGDRVLLDILDTRGIAECNKINDSYDAEKQLIDQVVDFCPDVAIFVLNATTRDDSILQDIELLKKVLKKYQAINKIELPVVAVVNKVDEIPPARIKNPKEYTENKINSISENVKRYKTAIVSNGLKIHSIVPVSSLMDWQTPDGIEVNADNINNFPKSDIENLQIQFDGRFQIETLLNSLEDAIQDFSGKMGLRMALRLEELMKKMAGHLVGIFSSISSGVAVTPIPIADIYILISLQTIMVMLIAALSGRELSFNAAKEFIASLGGVVGAGVLFRFVAQQTSKLANVLFPGAGSAISATIAFSGTYSIGKAATSYYIEEVDLKFVKKKFKENHKRAEKESKRALEPA